MAYFNRASGDRTQQLYYEYHHQPSEFTVVLSHGFGMSSRVWDNTLSRLLNAGYAVLCYDQRCCGLSDKDFADVSVATQGDDLVALCNHLDLDAVVLNGWSFGGALVIDAGAKLGARLVAIVSTAGATPRYTQAEGFRFGGTAADVQATVDALQQDRINFLHGLYFDGVFAVPVAQAVKQHCWQLALAASPGADASLGALADLDQRDLMSELTCPGLFVVGGLDGVVVPDIGRYAAHLMPNGTLLELANCGHAPFLEDADAYHAGLLKFLGEL